MELKQERRKMMEKQLIVCASPYEHKYFFEPNFEDMPGSIKEELIEATATIAEAVNGIISIGFNKDGNIYIEQTSQEDIFVDDIGAALEIKRFQKEKKELLQSLKMWYVIYRTDEGQVVKDIILMKGRGLEEEVIIQKITEQYGIEKVDFAKSLLEGYEA